MDAREQLAFLSAHITTVNGQKGEIAEWGSLILENQKMNGCQRIRCFPPGIFSSAARKRLDSDSVTGANGFHGNNVHDCIFAIPGPDSDLEVSLDEFDYKDDSCKKAVLYGRVYCIFSIAIKFKQKRRRNDPVGSEVDFIVKEDCILMKEFIKCAPSFTQGGIAQGNVRSSNALSSAGCVKLREAPHSSSIWRVLPVRHVLGQVPLAPLTHQKSKRPSWRHRDDVTEERMWWTIDWTMNWGRDKSYKICRELQEQLESRRPQRRRPPGQPEAGESSAAAVASEAEFKSRSRRGRGRPMNRSRSRRKNAET